MSLTSRWIWKADRDFALATQVSDSFPEMAAFHYQQAAEKYLKAYLSHRQIPTKKTHNIGTLTLMASHLDAEFAKLVVIADVDAITEYADFFGYPNEEEVDFPEPAELEAARRFCEAVRQMVVERIEMA